MSQRDKFDLFWDAASCGVIEAASKYDRWGKFSIDNADVLLLLQKFEQVDPATAAVTWGEETTFRFYSEANPNRKSNPDDEFDFYDVGPFQVNVRTLKLNIANRFLYFRDLDLDKVLGTKAPIFNGDPFLNARAGCRILQRIGRAPIVGTNKVVLYDHLSSEQWADLDDDLRNERRAVAYTGPDARVARQQSYRTLAPLFRQFFSVYNYDNLAALEV